ncbi:putative WSC domain-containing protein 1 [Homarus americanus]|uniref:Putative WSC domain-containing protein 1 n=1 Tax=Homarus americanus TaxID=6706 RepID=A0A8J5MUC6_HOMAM|nr:putative WSC domain-containing protein 1 [Homarus americanus]
MLTRWPPLLLLLLVATTTRVHAAFVEGECYKDDIINPHVTVSGGNFDPESLIPDTCKDFCGRLNFQYAAADEGKYCYCLQDLGTLILESGSCTEYCSDGSACGGPTPGLLTVWTTSVLSGKLKIVLDATAPYMFKVGSVSASSGCASLAFGEEASVIVLNEVCHGGASLMNISIF